MNKQNIQQIVRDLFRQNFNLYPESYTDNAEAVITAKEVAKGYWDNRTDEEEQRENEAGVTLQDYENWCVAELNELNPEAPASNKFQTWASEINKDWSTGYKAEATEDALSVNFNSEEIGRIDYSNGRYTVTGTDKDAVEQLEYMVNR